MSIQSAHTLTGATTDASSRSILLASTFNLMRAPVLPSHSLRISFRFNQSFVRSPVSQPASSGGSKKLYIRVECAVCMCVCADNYYLTICVCVCVFSPHTSATKRIRRIACTVRGTLKNVSYAKSSIRITRRKSRERSCHFSADLCSPLGRELPPGIRFRRYTNGVRVCMSASAECICVCDDDVVPFALHSLALACDAIGLCVCVCVCLRL